MRHGGGGCADIAALDRVRPAVSLAPDGAALPARAHARLSSIAQRARVARTFQNIRLFGGMTVLENLHGRPAQRADASPPAIRRRPVRPARLRARPSARRSTRRCYWLERIGLVDRADDPAGDLPYGAQRRLEIARAMCTDPRAAVPRRAGRRPQPARDRRTQRRCCSSSATSHGTSDPADRARHGRGDGDLRPHRRPRLRREDLRRHARRRARRPAA